MNILIEFENRPVLFEDPVSIIQCNDPSLLSDCFQRIEDLIGSGYYVAGFISYEAGYCFEERLQENKKYDFPLLMMAAYEHPQTTRANEKASGKFAIKDLRLNITKDQYSDNIDLIREHIAKGDVYQITYCIKYHFEFQGDPRSLYSELLHVQPVPYSALIESDKFQILSLSPERFIKKERQKVITEPMKGTWQRGNHLFSDMLAHFRFSHDIKNKAENLMITDLLRNDLGRIGKKIHVPKMFTITKYNTLYQMTSTVAGEVPKDIPLYNIFSALFPSGSVTGAPKIRAMQIIKEVEKEERNIYTGAIGYITPDRDMYFNIPIRTILIRGQKAEMGIGGGIVWDSTANGEWEEGSLKAKFLTDME